MKSTKWASDQEGSRRSKFIERMSNIPISVAAEEYETPKGNGVVSTRSTGPITEPALSYAPEPGEVPRVPHIPSALDKLEEASPSMRVTYSETRGGDGRLISSFGTPPVDSSSSSSKKISVPGPTTTTTT